MDIKSYLYHHDKAIVYFMITTIRNNVVCITLCFVCIYIYIYTEMLRFIYFQTSKRVFRTTAEFGLDYRRRSSRHWQWTWTFRMIFQIAYSIEIHPYVRGLFTEVDMDSSADVPLTENTFEETQIILFMREWCGFLSFIRE